MQPSIPSSSSVSVFVIERMAAIHSLKCTMPFSFVVPLLSFALTHCHLLSLVVTRCITRCHSLSLVITRWHWLSFVVTRCTTLCHSLSLVVIRCHSLYHSLSFVVTRCATRCHSLSLDVPLVCIFINDPKKGLSFYKFPRGGNLKQQWLIKICQNVSCLLLGLKSRLEKDAISAGPMEIFLPHPTTLHPPTIKAPPKNKN